MKSQISRWDAFLDDYDHSRRHCGCGRIEALYRAIWCRFHPGYWKW